MCDSRCPVFILPGFSAAIVPQTESSVETAACAFAARLADFRSYVDRSTVLSLAATSLVDQHTSQTALMLGRFGRSPHVRERAAWRVEAGWSGCAGRMSPCPVAIHHSGPVWPGLLPGTS